MIKLHHSSVVEKNKDPELWFFITSVGKASEVSWCTSETSSELFLPFTVLGEGTLFRARMFVLLLELSNDFLGSCVLFFGRERGVLFTFDLIPLATTLFLAPKTASLLSALQFSLQKETGSLAGADKLEVFLVFSNGFEFKPTRIVFKKEKKEIQDMSKDGRDDKTMNVQHPSSTMTHLIMFPW